MFKPYGVASYGIGLLGIDPRTLEVFLGFPTAGLFYDLHVLLGCFHPWSLSLSLSPGIGSPSRFTYFFFYTNLRSLSFVHV